MTSRVSHLHRVLTNTALHFHITQMHLVGLFGRTLVHTTFPLTQWQVLQSSSHLSPSGVTCPLTEQGLLVTVLNINHGIRNISKREMVCLWCRFVRYHLVKTSYLLDSGVQSCLTDTGSDIRWSHPHRWSQRYTGEDWHSLISVTEEQSER